MRGRSLMMATGFFWVAIPLAWAQMATSQFAPNARRYLNQPIGLRGLYCYSASSGYECRSGEPLRIVTDAMPAGPAKRAMDNDCGEMDGIELSASCRFTLQLVPTGVATRNGDYTRGGKNVRGSITVVTATVISAKKE